jgi:hypothetical protein
MTRNGWEKTIRAILLFLIILLNPLLGVWIREQFVPSKAFPALINQQAQGKLESTDLIRGWTKTEVISYLSTAASSDPAIAVDTEGNIHLVWSENNYLGGKTDEDIFHRCWNATMGTWGSIEDVSFEHNGTSYAPSMAVDKEGNLHIVWIDTSDYNGAGTDEDIFYRRWNATTRQWTPTVVVSNFSESYSANPDIVVDMDGNIHIVWVDSNYNGSGSDGDIFYRSWNTTTGIWTETELVTFESAQTSNMPKIAVDLKGTVHVVWEELPGLYSAVYYKYRNATTHIWSAAEWVSTESVKMASNPQIAVDAKGTVYAAWADHSAYGGSGSDDDIFYKTRNATTGVWTITQVLSTESTVNSGEPAITIDREGNLHATWRDAKIFYKFFNASTGLWAPWELVSSESTGIVSKPTIAVDPAGDVYLAWEDTSNYQGSGTDRDIFYKRTARLPDAPRLAAILPNPDPDGNIELTWTAVEMASRYYLYQDTAPITDVEGRLPCAATPITNYTDTLFSNGIYFYAIVASTDLINGSLSNCENITVALPLAAPHLSPIVPNPDSDGIIQLNWNAVAGATQYYLYRNTSAITALDSLCPIRMVTANGSVELLAIGGTYYYAIVAGNAWVNSSLSNCENVTVSLVPNLPSPPMLSPISPNPDADGLIQLEWTNVTGATSYYVFRSSANITSVSGLAPLAAVSQCGYQDRLVRNGTYYYAIVTGNLTGNSSISNCESVRAELILHTWINLSVLHFSEVIHQDDLLSLELNLTRAVPFPVNLTLVISGEHFAGYNHSFSFTNNSLFIRVELPYKMAHILDQGQRTLQVRLLFNGTPMLSLELSVTVRLSSASIFIMASVLVIGAVTAATVTYHVEKRSRAQRKTSKMLTQLLGRNPVKGASKGAPGYGKLKPGSTASAQQPDEGAWALEEVSNEKLRSVNLLLESVVMLFQSRAIDRATYEVVKADLLAERRKLKQAIFVGHRAL